MADVQHGRGGLCWTGEVALRWRDLDAFGHLYHAEFLVLLDEARMAMFATAVSGGPEFVVARLELDFRTPVQIADGPLLAEVRVERIGRSSVTLRERLSTRDARVAVESRCVVVMWDLTVQTSRAVTDGERRALTAGA